MAGTLEHSENFGEDQSSICEEERVRKLFQACDGDGDGFIDSQDLRNMCRELNLEHSLEELMRELGADELGRVSFEEFLRCRLALRPEVDAAPPRPAPLPGPARSRRAAMRQPAVPPPPLEPPPAPAAPAPPPPPHHQQQQLQRHRATPEYLPTGSDHSLGAASAGKHESWEFDSGARDLSPEPHALQKIVEAAGSSLGAGSSSGMFELANKLHLAALTSLKGEILDLSNRLHSVTQERDLLEERLTKAQVEVQAQRYEERINELHSVIAELRRSLERRRATSIQEDDVISENAALRNAVGSTANLAEAEQHQVGCYNDETQHPPGESAANADSSERCEDVIPGVGDAADVETTAAQEACTLTPPGSCCDDSAPLEEGERGDFGRKKHRGRGSPEAHLHHHHLRERSLPSNVVTCSLAEELAMACGSTGSGPDHGRSPRKVSHTPVAESLVSELRAADAAELARGGELAARHEVEREQLSARLEHARAQNRVLALALEESRAQNERLILLVGKYESNATALRLALGYSDRAIEAYDVLVALLESELGLLLASCRSLGLASFGLHAADAAPFNNVLVSEEVSLDGIDKASLLKKARDNRYAAETVARHVLARLETVAVGMPAAPWEDYSHAASEGEWGQAEERRLRDHIVRLKTERATVRGTVLELESCHVEPPGACVTLADACKLDLETAVLMQELMAVREERAELRARLFLMEKDKAALDLRLGAQELQLQQLQAQLQDLQPSTHHLHQRSGSLEGEQSSPSEEASRREARLRERMQGLVATLEKVSKNSEMRHQQSADLINDLKHANSALLQTLDRSKKKYQSRIKKLEQRMLDMAERHAHEVRGLKQRVADLENEVAVVSRAGHCTGIASVGVTTHSSTASETSL
ncbi:Uncharacterized protein GBIM_01746 [Gryllus bimaculatus]|nr:Uncharacterized protein GBIM_01746 [Gryllus bimaculatus]